MNEKVLEVLNANNDELEKLLSDENNESIHALESEIATIAQRSVFLFAYISARNPNTSSSDPGHEKAIEISDDTKKKVRKIMGYAYP